MGETATGRISAHTELVCVERSARTRAPERIVAQARTGVTLTFRSLDAANQISRPGQVALAAYEVADRLHVTWIQTGHFAPSHVERFDGSTSRQSLDLRHVSGFREFTDGDRVWFIDSNSRYTPRYGGAGYVTGVVGHRSGEIIYDRVNTSSAFDGYFADHSDVRAVEVTTLFRAHLYPFAGGFAGFWSRDPIVAVEWAATERLQRERPSDPARHRGGSGTVVRFLTRPRVPAGMRSAMTSYAFE